MWLSVKTWKLTSTTPPLCNAGLDMDEFREALQNAHIMASPDALDEMCVTAAFAERLFCSDISLAKASHPLI